MEKLLKGLPVANALDEETGQIVEKLTAKGIPVRLELIRVGEKAEDLSYEKNIVKRCEKNGILVEEQHFDESVTTEELAGKIRELNDDKSVHGVLFFLPFPKTCKADEKKVREALDPDKDVDGCTERSLSGVFTGSHTGFAPCTAQAVMEILSYYGIPLTGKKAVVMGRSLVAGRPLAMLMLAENATVTICHTKTEDLKEITRGADILASTVGKAELVDEEYLGNGQIVLDVGINWNERTGKICGDVKAEAVQEKALSYTPVPGGVGGVTTAVLARHVAEAAERQNIKAPQQKGQAKP